MGGHFAQRAVIRGGRKSWVSWENRLKHVAISDVGLRRANNQDAFSVMIAGSPQNWKLRGHLFLVADGMGAHAAGELASKLSADTVPHVYSKLTNQPPSTAIVEAVKEANREIFHRGQTHEEFQGMGTTTSAMLLLPQGALIAHVGDSRIYRLRANGQFEQLTFDHSLIWELQARGQLKGLSSEQVPKNIITRSLGPAAEVEVDLEGPFPVEAGDTFLLCSDGLSGQFEDVDYEMAAILASLPPEQAAQALVDIANLRGGPDNITLIVVKVLAPLTDAIAGDDDEDEVEAPEEGSPWVIVGWVAALVLLVAGVLSGIFFSPVLAAICIIAGIITGVFTWQYQPKEQGSLAQMTSGRYGRGPYQAWKASVNEKFTHTLAGLTDELRQAATKEDWAVDWYSFNKHVEQAQQATANQQFSQSIVGYCSAISFMMSELRNQRRKTKAPEG